MTSTGPESSTSAPSASHPGSALSAAPRASPPTAAARAPARAASPALHSANPATASCATKTETSNSSGTTAISSTEAWPCCRLMIDTGRT